MSERKNFKLTFSEWVNDEYVDREHTVALSLLEASEVQALELAALVAKGSNVNRAFRAGELAAARLVPA